MPQTFQTVTIYNFSNWIFQTEISRVIRIHLEKVIIHLSQNTGKSQETFDQFSKIRNQEKDCN